MKSIKVAEVNWHEADSDEIVGFLEKASGLDERGQPSIHFRFVSIPSMPPFHTKVWLTLRRESLFETFQYAVGLLDVRWRVEGNTIIMTHIESEGMDPKLYQEYLRKSGHPFLGAASSGGCN